MYSRYCSMTREVPHRLSAVAFAGLRRGIDNRPQQERSLSVTFAQNAIHCKASYVTASDTKHSRPELLKLYRMMKDYSDANLLLLFPLQSTEPCISLPYRGTDVSNHSDLTSPLKTTVLTFCNRLWPCALPPTARCVAVSSK